MYQVEMVSLNELVPRTHIYRKISDLFPTTLVRKSLKELEHVKGADGYGIECLFKCLFLQYLEDLSDRELERFLQENTAGKWFCGFGLSTTTPSFSLFTK
ncbi:MAG: transposase, partial [Alphaproteobacteria bacterium]|nr:transposase [Alphaproteobacteria bacterium]